ncbi:unnamed protein product [Spodoptera exigua]|nr:unnamed protein product [Spodoptera exigua]
MCVAHARWRGGRLPNACSRQYSPAGDHTYHRRFGVSAPLVPRENLQLILACDCVSPPLRSRSVRLNRSAERCTLARSTGEVAQGGRRAPVRPGHPVSQYTTHHTHKRTCSQVTRD